MEQLFNVLVIAAYSTLALAVVAGGINLRKLPRGLKRFFIYLLAKVLIELLSELSNWYSYDNLWLLHYNVILEFVLIMWVYKEIFVGGNTWNGLILIGTMVLSGMRVAIALGAGNSEMWQLISNVLVHAVVIFLSCKYLYHHILIGSKPVKSYFFWINAGLLCYFSSTLIGDLVFSDFLKQSNSVAVRLWMINLIITIAFYLLGGFTFFKWGKSKKQTI